MQKAWRFGKAASYQGPTGSESSPTYRFELLTAQSKIFTRVVSSDATQNEVRAASAISGYFSCPGWPQAQLKTRIRDKYDNFISIRSLCYYKKSASEYPRIVLTRFLPIIQNRLLFPTFVLGDTTWVQVDLCLRNRPPEISCRIGISLRWNQNGMFRCPARKVAIFDTFDRLVHHIQQMK